MTTHHVHIRRKHTDLYEAIVCGEVIATHRAPNGACARKLLESGVSRDDEMIIFSPSSDTVSFRGTVGSFAGFTVTEPDRGGLRRIKYVPRDFSAHLPPEPINAGGDVFSPSSPATSFSNERGFLGS